MIGLERLELLAGLCEQLPVGFGVVGVVDTLGGVLFHPRVQLGTAVERLG